MAGPLLEGGLPMEVVMSRAKMMSGWMKIASMIVNKERFK